MAPCLDSLASRRVGLACPVLDLQLELIKQLRHCNHSERLDSMPVSVRIPTPLRKLTGGHADVSAEGESVAQVLDDLEGNYAGFRSKILDDSGDIRRFINLFVNGEDVRYLKGLESGVKEGDEISIIPAIAGGAAFSGAA